MRESSTPLIRDLPEESNITDLLLRNVAEVPQSPAYRRKVGGSHWATVTWQEFYDEVVRVAKGLVAQGVTPGDRVGIMSRTRYEWTLFDLSCWFAGAVVVPVYETSSIDQIEWIGADAGIKAILVEDESCEQRVEAARAKLPHLEQIWSIADGGITHLIESGSGIDDAAVEKARSHATLADTATIIYTSGTTGRPKGCELTHGNFALLADNGCEILDILLSADGGTGSTLLFIPLSHVFARYVEILCLAGKATVGHTSDMKDVIEDLGTFKPTFILTVPRVFEKVYNSAEQKAKGDGKGKIFTQAAKVAVAYSRGLDGKGAPLGVKLQHRVFDKLVYKKIRDVMGGNVRYAVSGSAPLGDFLAHFFRGIGVTILEGYGLTESTAPTSVNAPGKEILGTVGFPLPGCSVRIAEDGEILLQGIHIFSRYRNNEEATEAAFTDGWFHTGDLGAITPDGAITITGRKKEILITAGGKNVVPTTLEDRLRIHPLISQAIVIGDAKPFIGALITLDADMLPAWLKGEGLDDMTVEQAAKHPKVLAAIDGAVEYANKAVSRAESIRKHTVLTVDFSIESGHLTPSVKLRRRDILADFASEAEAIYAS